MLIGLGVGVSVTTDRGLALANSLATDLALVLDVPSAEVGDPERFLVNVAHAYEARHKYYDAPV